MTLNGNIPFGTHALIDKYRADSVYLNVMECLPPWRRLSVDVEVSGEVSGGNLPECNGMASSLAEIECGC